MGLTIHYNIAASKDWVNSVILSKLEAAREFAVSLGFREVSEVTEFKDNWCDFNWIRENGHEEDDPFFWAKIQSQRHFQSPWEPGRHRAQCPNRMIVFSAWPTYGSEPMNIGVCSYPRHVIPADKEVTYSAWSEVFSGHATTEQSKVLHAWMKKWNLRKMREPKRRPWRNTVKRIWETDGWWAEAEIIQGEYVSHRRGYNHPYGIVRMRDTMKGQIEFKHQGSVEEATVAFSSLEFQKETSELMYGREVVIPASFGEWGSFIKTQYANDPRCEGFPNFLFAHAGACLLLDKLKEVGFKVRVSDEGNFYKNRDISALAKEIQSWDMMIASMGGFLKDMAHASGVEAEGAMDGRPDFEKLEFKATQDVKLGEMLRELRKTLPEVVVDEVAG